MEISEVHDSKTKTSVSVNCKYSVIFPYLYICNEDSLIYLEGI